MQSFAKSEKGSVSRTTTGVADLAVDFATQSTLDYHLFRKAREPQGLSFEVFKSSNDSVVQQRPFARP